MPTQAGLGVNTFQLVPYTSQATRFSVRLDHKINDHNQIRATYLRAFYGPNPDVGTSSLAGGFSGTANTTAMSSSAGPTPFPRLCSIDTYASYFHLPIYRTPQNSNVNFSSIIPGLGPELIEGAPQITITNITSVSEAGSKDLEQVIQANTAVTKVLSKHTIKAGFSYLWDNHWNDAAVARNAAPSRSTVDIHRPTPITYSPVLLLLTSCWIPELDRRFRLRTTTSRRNLSSQYGMYVQDDWKLRPNLTLKSGLRYDLQWFRRQSLWPTTPFTFPASRRSLSGVTRIRHPQFQRSLTSSDHSCPRRSACPIMSGTTLDRIRTMSRRVSALPMRPFRILWCAALSASTTT